MTPDLIALALSFADQAPEPEDVKAGPIALAVFLGLCVAVALLCWSFVRQLRKAQRAKDAGAYGDEPERPGTTGSTDPTPEEKQPPTGA